ncbi:MAG TPA: S9 family peptidase [Anaerolineaceae bacterium]|nr:S9 family peptidase [Anaerolineaceae bacterium]
MATEKPFGMWASPISAAMLGQRLRLNDVQWDTDGKTLLWHESHGDRGTLVARPLGEAARELTVEHSVRGGVLYGGGEFTVANGTVIFAEKSGRLFRRSLGYGGSRPLTPPYGSVAAPALSPDGRWAAYVFSDGRTDLLGLVDSDGSEWPQKLVRGADFYLDPVWHPDGTRIAWVEWDHPDMPWDRARICLGTLAGSPPRIERTDLVAGGQGGMFLQPQFSPDGRWLACIDASGEWDNLLLIDLESGERRSLVAGDGFHLTPPVWVQRERTYGWSSRGDAIYYLRIAGGRTSLWVVDVPSGDTSGAASRPVEVGPYTWIKQLAVSPVDDQLAFIASAPDIPDRIVRLDAQGLHTEARSEGETVDPAYFPVPQQIAWPSEDGETVYGLYYPPRNPNFTAQGLPPAIVSIHGGPTSQAYLRFSAEIAYFTSRGYGWLDLNYRGSSGYGRAYAQALYERWGEIDTEDAAGAAQALAEQGLADGGRIVIRGGSSGGYTVLNVLARYPGRFKAGICMYPVANLFTLAMETHKFEERYHERLVGALPEAAEKYRAWSPIYHADQIRDPLAIFQGAEDRVVPPGQTETLAAALKAHGVPLVYQVYAGEGHGFRRSETVQDFMHAVERFLLQYVLFG